MASIIGRRHEQEELLRLYHSDRAEFTVVYGRRRVGKTFLVKQVFKDNFAFYHTGLSPFDEETNMTKAKQLEHFYRSLVEYGMEEGKKPKNWLEAFTMLKTLLSDKKTKGKQVVFIDELPWMDTPGSGLLTAVEAFWNGWGDGRDSLLFIVCGSATSWMEQKLVRNYGGLYGRLTYELHLKPFSLGEVEQYLKFRGVELGRMDVAMAYMVFGGMPYYLNFFEKGLSLAQNIDRIMFCRNASLAREIDILFKSQFRNPDLYERVVMYLSTRRYGYSRREISEKTGISSGSRLSVVLDSLEESDFIEQYKPFDAVGKEVLYRLTDPFCLFSMRFKDVKGEHFWQENQHGASIRTWMGMAFEHLCALHVDKIKVKLGISGMQADVMAFTLRGDENHDGMQCDMLIVRRDNVVNLCEMKFSQDIFAIDRNYYFTLQHRISMLIERLLKRQVVHLTFVTANGVKRNEYSGIIQSEVVIDDLF